MKSLRRLSVAILFVAMTAILCLAQYTTSKGYKVNADGSLAINTLQVGAYKTSGGFAVNPDGSMAVNNVKASGAYVSSNQASLQWTINPDGTVFAEYNGGGPTPAFVSSCASPVPSTSPCTLNTTGASLLVAICSSTSVVCTIADSLANAWNYTQITVLTNGNTTRIAYSYAATAGGALVTGSDTITPSGGAPSTAVFALSNTLTTAAVLDVGNNAVGLATTAIQPGSVTPTAGDACVTGFGSNLAALSVTSINSGFTGIVSNTNAILELVAGAYALNVTGTALNPLWVVTTTQTGINAVIACFK